MSLIDSRRENLLMLSQKSEFLVLASLSRAKERLAENAAKAHALSPLSTLYRGYSVAEKNGKTVKSVSELEIGDEITLVFSDGRVRGNLTSIEKGE